MAVFYSKHDVDGAFARFWRKNLKLCPDQHREIIVSRGQPLPTATGTGWPSKTRDLIPI